ncbi:putative mitochondrial protein [Apostasia shenzhenica]|uniref:Putative mitochondrial protein n=1 Tax=Apostasia shenzhenica TaxID=1088818 RepID=A0A2I0B4M2_9ASPA|nr:putative mitochondrial protein [Apostasia shenzhenica]
MLSGDLHDLCFTGPAFTWCNNKDYGKRIWERLDRVLGNSSALDLWPGITIKHLPRIASDHCPLLVVFEPHHIPASSIRFEDAWLSFEEAHSIVQATWHRPIKGSPIAIVNKKKERTLKALKALKAWSKINVGDLSARAKKEATVEGLSNEEHLNLLHLVAEFNINAARVKTWWRQRAKAHWLAEGDRNSSYFHKAASGRKHRNRIKEITDGSGSLTTDEHEITNDTVVTLVPKIPHASEAKHFRPISLCNTIYKIIAKILVHRLKSLLPSLISIEQGAFIPGRSISDNCILAQDLIHKLHTSEASNGLFLIKADMEQAFDRISWFFLDCMLNIMAFPPTWRKWIMMCVTNPRYTILINGRRSAWITAKRGLRQGCPLSPYLFIICSEFLSHLIRHKVASGCLHGIKLSPRGSPHHHFLFADDVLLCAEADVNSAASLNWALTTYCTISGQKVNVNKSSILFSPKTPKHRRSSIRCCFDMREESNWTYLRIPLRKRRPSKDDFTDLLAKIRNHIHSWGTRQLSLAGRLTLINSVLSSTPVYILSHIFVPCSVLDCIEKLLRSFLWGGN